MSWDILFYAANEPPPPVAQMPGDWKGQPLGSLKDVRAKISSSLPTVDWSDPTWGIFEGVGYSYEFNVGKKEPCDSFGVHIRGTGDAVGPLVKLAQSCGWYVLDISQGEWLHHCASEQAGWERFQAYRDQAGWQRSQA